MLIMLMRQRGTAYLLLNRKTVGSNGSADCLLLSLWLVRPDLYSAPCGSVTPARSPPKPATQTTQFT